MTVVIETLLRLFLLLSETIIYNSSTEPGGPNGVTITTRFSGSNCLRRLAVNMFT